MAIKLDEYNSAISRQGASFADLEPEFEGKVVDLADGPDTRGRYCVRIGVEVLSGKLKGKVVRPKWTPMHLVKLKQRLEALGLADPNSMEGKTFKWVMEQERIGGARHYPTEVIA